MRDNQDQASPHQDLATNRTRLNEEMARIDERRRSRRSFLSTALAAGASTAVVAGVSTSQAAGGNTQTLPYQSDPNWVKNHFQNIINNETQHLDSLIAELGSFARPKPTFQNLAVTTLTQYVTMGAMFCATGAGAYLGSAPYIMNPFLLGQAGSIGQVELTQSGYLYSLLDQPLLPGGSPFSVPLTLNDVLTRLQPYVASLNGGPEPGFSTTQMSIQNDIDIFNVALIQEYLEVEFYTTNFPVIFHA